MINPTSLQSKFCIFDPATCSTYTDMSLLSEVALVILVEQPNSLTLKADQKHFFQQFLKKKRSCVLINGFSQDHEISRQHLPYWSDLPSNITFRGADPTNTPMKECAATATRINECLFQYQAFGLELNKRHRELILRLNASYMQGKVTTTSQGVIISSEEMNTIDRMCQDMQALYNPIRSIPVQKYHTPAPLLMLNTLKKFEKVCAVWTEDQFKHSSPLLEKLDVPHLILFSTNVPIALFESLLPSLTYPAVELNVLVETSSTQRGTQVTKNYEISTIRISKQLEQLFHPSLRGILKT